MEGSELQHRPCEEGVRREMGGGNNKQGGKSQNKNIRKDHL